MLETITTIRNNNESPVLTESRKVDLPMEISSTETVNKILHANGTVEAFLDPKLPDHVDARVVVKLYPSKKRDVKIYYSSKESLNSKAINQHELRHIGETRGLIDPLLRNSQGQIIKMPLTEYLLRRAEAEWKAEFAASPESSQRRLEARREYNKVRALIRLDKESDTKQVFGFITESLGLSYLNNFNQDYHTNINRNLALDALIQTSDSKKPKNEKARREKAKANLARQAARIKRERYELALRIRIGQINKKRYDNSLILMKDNEYKRFFPHSELNLKFEPGFETRLIDRDVESDKIDNFDGREFKSEVVGSFKSTGYSLAIKIGDADPKEVQVLTPPGFSSQRNQIANTLIKFMSRINHGLVVQSGYSHGAIGAGLKHAFDRHCQHASNDAKILLKRGRFYSPASQFARPITQREFLGLLRYAANHIYSISIKPDLEHPDLSRDTINCLANVPEDFALGTTAISMVFGSDGQFISATPFGKSTYPVLGLVAHNIKTKKVASADEVQYLMPPRDKELPSLPEGFVYKPTLIYTTGNGEGRIWTLRDTIKTQELYDSVFNDPEEPNP